MNEIIIFLAVIFGLAIIGGLFDSAKKRKKEKIEERRDKIHPKTGVKRVCFRVDKFPSVNRSDIKEKDFCFLRINNYMLTLEYHVMVMHNNKYIGNVSKEHHQKIFNLVMNYLVIGCEFIHSQTDNPNELWVNAYFQIKEGRDTAPDFLEGNIDVNVLEPDKYGKLGKDHFQLLQSTHELTDRILSSYKIKSLDEADPQTLIQIHNDDLDFEQFVRDFNRGFIASKEEFREYFKDFPGRTVLRKRAKRYLELNDIELM